MRTTNIAKLLSGISLGVLSSVNTAAASAPPSGPDIKDVFRSFLKQGKTASGSDISKLGPDILYVGDPAAKIPFLEEVHTPGGVNIQTRLPITGAAERPQQDLQELLEQVRQACEATGGTMDRRDILDGPSESNAPQVARSLNSLLKMQLVGQFWCHNQNGEAMFMVEVRPAQNARVPLIPIGWDWNIGMRFATGAVLQKHESQRTAYEKSVIDLRNKLKTGDAVQVLAADLPSQVIQQWHPRPGQNLGQLCGLVIETKPPLGKIQLGAVEQWIDISKLFPQGLAKKPDEVLYSSRLAPQSWCLR